MYLVYNKEWLIKSHWGIVCTKYLPLERRRGFYMCICNKRNSLVSESFVEILDVIVCNKFVVSIYTCWVDTRISLKLYK